jgi:hypothetical protein
MSQAPDAAAWLARAKALCERALFNFDLADPQPDLGAAVACLRVAEGDLDASELGGFPFPGEPEAAVCICPAALLARDGYRGNCPTHAAARAYLTGTGG